MDIKEIENNINIRNFNEIYCWGTVLHMYTNEKSTLTRGGRSVWVMDLAEIVTN